MGSRCWTLSTAGTAFLWEECPRCFYLDVVRGFPRPRPGKPAEPSAIDELMKASWSGRRTETLTPEMPAGVVDYGERWVQSEPIDVHLPDTVRRCLLRGKPDTVVRLDEGGYALVDFKMGEARVERLDLYARQLHGHAYALEHPAPGATALGPIRRLGLLVFEPTRLSREATGIAALDGSLSWVEVPRDDHLLFGLLAEVLSVLERPEPPGGAPLCDWCVYRDASRRTGL